MSDQVRIRRAGHEDGLARALAEVLVVSEAARR
jgi:hypothetical protein